MNKLEREPIFIQSLIWGYVNEQEQLWNLKDVSDFCLDLEKNSSSRSLSNRGGFQSNDYEEEFPEILDPIVKEITRHAKDYYEFAKVDAEPKLLNLWVNVNRKHNYNSLHTHPHSFLSGTLYVKVPSGDAGNFVLHRDGKFKDYLDFVAPSDPEFYHYYSIKPEPNKILLFPSYMQHSVESNLTEDQDDARISLAFNFK